MSTQLLMTKEQQQALAWAVRRAAENSSLLFYNSPSVSRLSAEKAEAEYKNRVKRAREALRILKAQP